MAGKSTERKGKKAALGDLIPSVTNFLLPTSLPCSEIEFPVLVNRKTTANWGEIVEESEKKHEELTNYKKEKLQEFELKSPFKYTETEYIQNEMLVHLIPVLEETLKKAKHWNSLEEEKSFFNGIDHIVQLLWNNNPRFPIRKFENLHLFNMPWVRKYLRENPRPHYPKSGLWTEDYAATIIQKSVRRYFVLRDEEVQEMRMFWKKLKYEKQHAEIKSNPFLSRQLASMHTILK